jgi:polar amino acid transport system substrate-binding protein
MKTIQSIAVFAVTFLLSIGSFTAQNLKLVSDVWPPFTNEEGEKAIAIEMVQTALSRIDIQSTIEIKDFEEIIGSLKTGTYSGSAALWKTPTREEFISFSNPYLQNQLILVGLRGAEVKEKSLKDLGTAKIGIVEGYAYGERVMKGNSIEFIKSESDQRNLEKLISKEIDYMLVDNILIYYLIKNQVNNIEEFLAIASEPLDTKNLYFGLSKQIENSEEIIKLFNEEIQKMILDGTYHEILGVNWVETDINGDGIKELVSSGKTAGENKPSETNIYEIFEDGKEENEQRYFVNGVYYNDWGSIPDSLKKTPTVTPLKNLNPGLQLNF